MIDYSNLVKAEEHSNSLAQDYKLVDPAFSNEAHILSVVGVDRYMVVRCKN